MTAPDETPRATLREDERAVESLAADLAERLCDWRGCGYDTGCNCRAIVEARFMPSVRSRIAPLLAAARAEERERVAVAIESTYTPVQPSLIGEAHADALALATRIARTAPSTDQATTPPGVTGGSGEGHA